MDKFGGCDPRNIARERFRFVATRNDAISDVSYSDHRKTIRVSNHIPKHLMKDRLSEGVEFVEGAGAEAAERVRLIQYPRNPLLLLQRREGDFDTLNSSL